MKKIILILFLFPLVFFGQENINYQKPSKEILELLEFDRPPTVLYDEQKKYMVFLYRDNYKSIKDLSIKELRLGGLRIDPKTNIGSRITYYNNVKIKNIKDRKSKINQISGLPDNAKLSNIVWSPDQKNSLDQYYGKWGGIMAYEIGNRVCCQINGTKFKCKCRRRY